MILPEKIERNIMPEPNSGCWLWAGSLGSGGYGQVYLGGRNPLGAHRVVYEFLVGEIPRGLDLDHLCRVRSCVNPAHLEPVSRRVNLRRGIGFAAQRAKQTHCTHGHEFTEKNTILRPNGTRDCRECNRLQAATWRAKQKGKK